MLAAAGLGAMFLLGPGLLPLPQTPDSRVAAIQKRGELTCGVEAAVPGFVATDADGRYAGLDVDICRAVAAAILGDATRVRFVRVTHVTDLAANPDIDMVARRLTWELRREQPLGLLFGPITFYDGQGFLVPRAPGAQTPRDLANRAICVAGGPVFELNLDAYFADHAIPFRKIVIESAHAYDDIAAALTDGRCEVYSGDLSDLGVVRQRTTHPAAFAILDALISKEPLAPLVRDNDVHFFNVLRWTVAALIRAEELGVSSANAETMRTSRNLEVQRLLGVVPGNGKALGLRESWSYDAIRQVGNYGEIFDRHLGPGSAIGLDRGLNRLWTDGGLMYAPPLR